MNREKFIKFVGNAIRTRGRVIFLLFDSIKEFLRSNRGIKGRNSRLRKSRNICCKRGG